MTRANSIVSAVLLGTAAVFVFLFFLAPSLTKTADAPAPVVSKIHVYHDSSRSLEIIRIKAFYTLPQRVAPTQNWYELFTSALERAAKFHDVQFRGRSRLVFDVFPQPVVLEKTTDSYGTSTARGNPAALLAISEELDRRVFLSDGDLFDSVFAGKKSGEYQVIGILYEGVGSSGGMIYESDKGSVSEISKELGIPEAMIYKVDVSSAEGFFLFSRDYLTHPEYPSAGATTLYHEFAHTIGLPDEYDGSTDTPFSEDIMGSGRWQAIETGFIERSFTRDMGLHE